MLLTRIAKLWGAAAFTIKGLGPLKGNYEAAVSNTDVTTVDVGNYNTVVFSANEQAVEEAYKTAQRFEDFANG